MSYSRTQGSCSLTHQEKLDGPKVELDIRRALQNKESEAEVPFSAIVRVHQPWHVPDYLTLRARISSLSFTCQITRSALKRLEQDPTVASISRSTRIRME